MAEDPSVPAASDSSSSTSILPADWLPEGAAGRGINVDSLKIARRQLESAARRLRWLETNRHTTSSVTSQKKLAEARGFLWAAEARIKDASHVDYQQEPKQGQRQPLPEWRMTRRAMYPPDAPLSQRQGYYVRAATRDEAYAAMRERFPGDEEGFDVQEWSGGRRETWNTN